jgi:hypothetical protein
MIALRFRLPNTATYYLRVSDEKTRNLTELLPYFPELLPQTPEKEENGAFCGRISEVLSLSVKRVESMRRIRGSSNSLNKECFFPLITACLYPCSVFLCERLAVPSQLDKIVAHEAEKPPRAMP